MICIYKATNVVNGKIYIGKTVDFKRRIREHHRHATKDGGAFHKDILLFGFASFTFDVIEECETNELNKKEIHYINEFRKIFGENKIYNICKGGDGGQTHDTTGKNNPMYGKHLSSEAKQKISEYNLGKIVSKESREKISKALTGKPKSKEAVAKKSHIIFVQNIYTKEILQFPSKAEMERVLHCNTITITKGKVTKQGWQLYKQEDVSTNGDECSHVGLEISASSKRETV